MTKELTEKELLDAISAAPSIKELEERIRKLEDLSDVVEGPITLAELADMMDGKSTRPGRFVKISDVILDK